MPSHLLKAGFLLGYFSTLKMQVIQTSETSVHIRTTWNYIPEDGNINMQIAYVLFGRITQTFPCIQ
jgi:hypothetical protein